MELEHIFTETLVAKIEFLYKPVWKIVLLPEVSNSSDVYQLFLNYWDKAQIESMEQFRIMLLTKSGRVVGIGTISIGDSATTLIDPKHILVAGLLTHSEQVVIAHNHPGGKHTPGPVDHFLNRKIKRWSELLGISVQDHMIISTEGYYSFAEEGAL